MALAVEDAGKVWQKAKGNLMGANPAIQNAFLELRKYISTQKGNIQLQFIPFTEVQADAAGGTVLLAGAAKLYGAFVKKENSATDNFTWLYDDATDDTTAANARVEFPLLIANDEQMYINPGGLDLATGIVVTQYTGPLGTTDGSNGGSGFVIVGNP